MDIHVKYLERKIESLERKLSRLKNWIKIEIKDVEIPDEILESDEETDWDGEEDGQGQDKSISCQFGGEFIRKKAKKINSSSSKLSASQPLRTSTRIKNSKLCVKKLVANTVDRVDDIDAEDPLKIVIEDEEEIEDSNNKWVKSLPIIRNWSVFKSDSANDFYENVEEKDDSASRLLNKPKLLCLSCNEEFTNSIDLKKHKNLKHPSTEKVPCGKCEAVFASKELLRGHDTRVHKNGPKKCPICSQMLAYSSFTKHLRLHTQTELYLCQKCGKGFKQMCNLRAHEKEKHLDNLPKLKCTHENCSKEFFRKQQLTRHLETHLPLEERSDSSNKKYFKDCPYCGLSINSRTLKKHIFTKHLKIRSFTCPVENCEKSFYTKKDMDVHCSVHLNPRLPSFSLEFSQNCPESLTQFLSKHKKHKRKTYENSKVKVKVKVKKEQDIF